jgi:glutamate racemase
MAKIGIYDSGIGGLTTLAKLIIQFEHCDFWFFADNANFPLGTRCESDLLGITADTVHKMSKECDFLVLACNTASSHTSDDLAIKLLPPLDGLNPQSTLVLATPSTVCRLKLKENGFLTIDTPELAADITKLYFTKDQKRLAMQKQIVDGLRQKLSDIPKPQTVVIGCSHYMFIADIVKKLCPDALILDGNSRIIERLKAVVTPTPRAGAVLFEFSGENRLSDYVEILEELLNKEKERTFPKILPEN